MYHLSFGPNSPELKLAVIYTYTYTNKTESSSKFQILMIFEHYLFLSGIILIRFGVQLKKRVFTCVKTSHFLLNFHPLYEKLFSFCSGAPVCLPNKVFHRKRLLAQGQKNKQFVFGRNQKFTFKHNFDKLFASTTNYWMIEGLKWGD